MNDRCCRHEFKFYINHMDMAQLRSGLSHMARLDEHAGENNSYRVRSLYFDNFDDKALMEKLSGLDEREKFRIRMYNNDLSFIRLEKKSRKKGKYYKDNAVISAKECMELINGKRAVLKTNGSSLTYELYNKMITQLLRPKNIVEYIREAYTFPMGNVRITLDHDMRTITNIKAFLESEPKSIPITGIIILEVKYDDFMPDIVSRMITLQGRQASSFSKYSASRII